MKADVYDKIDKELLEMVEDVLLNRCDNATERMLEYAATLDPKSKPTAVRKKGQVTVNAMLVLSLHLPLQALKHEIPVSKHLTFHKLIMRLLNLFTCLAKSY